MTEQKELYCLGIHFKVLYEQGIKNKPFDFGQPCTLCKYSKDCDFDWLAMREFLQRETGISVNVKQD